MPQTEIIWDRTERLLAGWGACERLPLGMAAVEPRNIVGLHRTTPERLQRDARLARLLHSVRDGGWLDPFPDDLHLFLLPEGRYTVASKGNVRAYAARVCEIPWIYARVDVIVPHRLLTESIRKQLDRSASSEFRNGLLLGQLAQFALACGFLRHPE